MDCLPRDLQLRIIKEFDIDTRIACGLWGKLKVPKELQVKLEAVLKPVGAVEISNDQVYKRYFRSSDLHVTWYFVYNKAFDEYTWRVFFPMDCKWCYKSKDRVSWTECF